MNNIKSIPINIWDDYLENENDSSNETCMYVEDYEISLDDSKIFLEFIIQVMTDNLLFENIETKLVLYDSTIKYTNLPETYHVKRYEVKLKNISYNSKEVMLHRLINLNLHYNNIPFIFYSES